MLVHDIARARADAAAARDLGADLVEYRLDEIFTGGTGGSSGADGDHPSLADHSLEGEIRAICRLVSDSPVPCIATCRPTWEGGTYDGPEDARIALFEALGTLAPPRGHPPRYIDVELAGYARSANIRQKIHLAVDHPNRARDLAPSLILSIHDFDGRPSDLSRRVLAAQSHEACRVLKVAFRARTLRDNLELFDLLATRDRPTIALGMGEFGLLSRILAPKFGAFLTFASLRSTQTTAPGQPTLSEITGTYRFRSIGERTRVYGIVGWPVAQSLSPQIHNAGFEAVGHDGVYTPLPIPSDTSTQRDEADAPAAGAASPEDVYLAFKATMLSLIEHDALDFSGCSVSIPHKPNLVRLARERGWAIDPIAELCGAGNTLVIDRDLSSTPRSLRVLNTDAQAARECVEGLIGPLSGKRVALLGAGGVARAIAAACASAGGVVTIHARSADQAGQLAADLNASMQTQNPIQFAPIERLGEHSPDAIVNCTPVGMRHGPDPVGSPVSKALVATMAERRPRPCFFDTVYNPIDTPMLVAARAAGCPTIDGIEMFVRQAAAQFTAWTGSVAPTALFTRVAREALL